MMTLLLLALALGIFAHDGLVPSVGEGGALLGGEAAWVLGVVFGPKVLLAGAYGFACRYVGRRLGKARGMARLKRLDRFTQLYLVLLVALYGLDLYAGLLDLIRHRLFDTVLVDEVMAMTPTLLMLLWAWWVYYPIDRRLREASLMGRIDAGLPVYPIWSRGQYLLEQLRYQVMLILAPLLAIMAWIEAVMMYVPPLWVGGGGAWDLRSVLIIGGAGAVFLFAPLMLKRIWDTSPLPEGEIRERLTQLCRRHRVKVRELLLWRTHGGMMNAAVMGLIAPLRYVLLTDALLDMLDREQIEAVMAHELGHVRRGHMFWLLAAAAGALGVLEAAAVLVIQGVVGGGGPMSPPPASGHRVMVAGDAAWGALGGWAAVAASSPEVLAALVVAAAGLGWIAVFGWVSRRIERQADTFAVVSLSHDQVEPMRDERGGAVVDPRAAGTMIAALGQVAALNHIPPTRRSWRHGSIAWRQKYLRDLVAQPLDALPIDRQMRWIKVATVVALGMLLAAWWF